MPYAEEEIGVEHNVTELLRPIRSPEEQRETLLQNIKIAEDRKKILEDVKALLEAKSPDLLAYFDEHEVRRWGDRAREIPKEDIDKLEKLRADVSDRLERLKGDYKPVAFDDDGSEGELAAKEAAESEMTVAEAMDAGHDKRIEQPCP